MKDHRGHYLETICEIDLDAFGRNIRRIREWVAGREIILAVKANAYGHGVVPICRRAALEGIRYFGVANLTEGVALRDANIPGNIILLTPATLEQVPSIVYHDLTPNIVSQQFASALSAEAGKANKTIRCHIEIDTGMGRTGTLYDEAVGEILPISRYPNIEIEGIFSHFPSADSDNPDDKEFTRLQLRHFANVVERLRALGLDIPMVHISNSAGIMGHPIYGNAVRPGITAYGLYPSGETPHSVDVEPVLTMKTQVIQLRELPGGWSVSYGRTYSLDGAKRVAVIRAGYGDGLRRALSNSGEVLIRGKRCPIIGRVCMDTTMVLVDNDVELDDEVVIIGKQGDERITADEQARLLGTINYEVITGISERVQRVYIAGGVVHGV